MLTCREAEKMVMPFIEGKLEEDELDKFLRHVSSCSACKEELEIYYTVSTGLRQLDTGVGVLDISGALEDSIDASWVRVRLAYLRKIIYYAVNTLCVTGVAVIFLMQLCMWLRK